MRTALVGTALLALGWASAPPQNAGNRIFDMKKMHSIHITMSAAEWAVLQTSSARGGGATGGSDYRDASGRLIHVGSGFTGYFPWVRADVKVDGESNGEFKDAGIRYKGNLSFSSSSGAAPLFANFKMKFDVHGGKGEWNNERTFNLHAGVVDTSKMREALSYWVFREAGVPAPRTAYAELFFTVPGLYQDQSAGTFTLIEDVNRKFLERVLPPGNGLLMKPEQLRGGVQSAGDNWSAYLPNYRPDRDATPHEQQRVMEFAKLISTPDVTSFRSKIGSFLDVEGFLRFIAVNAMIVNTDSYLRGGHNFYLYLDPSDDRFRFIPWDQDLAMGSRPGMARIGGTAPANAGGLDVMRPFAGDQPLIYWIFDDPAHAARYKEIVRELGTKVFTAERLLPLADALGAIGSGRGPSPRPFLEGRTAYIRDLIASWK